VADLRSGHDVFSRFKAGRDGTLWYYSELLSVFQSRSGPNAPVVRELSATVREMNEAALD
jgi:hypothetical protein